MLDATRNGTPSLIVKGSGRAADLISDCVLLRYAHLHEYHVDAGHRDDRQNQVLNFFCLSVCLCVCLSLCRSSYLSLCLSLSSLSVILSLSLCPSL